MSDHTYCIVMIITWRGSHSSPGVYFGLCKRTMNILQGNFYSEFTFMPLLEIACWLTIRIWTSKFPWVLWTIIVHFVLSLVLRGQQRTKRNMSYSKEVSNLVVEQKIPRIILLLYWVLLHILLLEHLLHFKVIIYTIIFQVHEYLLGRGSISYILLIPNQGLKIYL